MRRRMRAIPSGRGSLSVSALCAVAVCLSLWTRVVQSGSLACSPPAASVQELARRAGVVFEGKLQEDARNGTESPVNASRQVADVSSSAPGFGMCSLWKPQTTRRCSRQSPRRWRPSAP